jgi:glutaconate CoA-transferase subunit B
VLVEKCDYVSAYGWGAGGAGARRALGLPGGGPKYCITPLGIFDFAEETKRMRLHSVHPGISPERVKQQTGFEIVMRPSVSTTEPPTAAELEMLRSRVDLAGRLRAE